MIDRVRQYIIYMVW